MTADRVAQNRIPQILSELRSQLREAPLDTCVSTDQPSLSIEEERNDKLSGQPKVFHFFATFPETGCT